MPGERILVIGSGGREHTLAWKLAQSPKIKELYRAPGNAGIAEHAELVDLKANDLKGLRDFAEQKNIGLTFVGPEDPLAEGIVDYFQEKGLRVFGPSKATAQIEGSKVFAKELMKKYNVPTAGFKVFDNAGKAIEYAKNAGRPLVVKADGLAAGKEPGGSLRDEEMIKAADKKNMTLLFTGTRHFRH